MSLLQKIVSFKGLFAKETYNFKAPTHRRHPITETHTSAKEPYILVEGTYQSAKEPYIL